MREFAPEVLTSQQVASEATHEHTNILREINEEPATVKVGGYPAKVDGERVDWTLEVPTGDLTYDGIAFIAPGYGAVKQTSSSLRRSLALRGIATMTAEPVRKRTSSYRETFRNPQDIHAATIESSLDAIRDTAFYRRLFPEVDFDKNIIICHSMGGLAAARFVEQSPDETDAVINIAAAGHGSPTVRELLQDVPSGLLPAIWHEVIPAMKNGGIECSTGNALKMARHIFRSPSRTLAEGLSCLRDDVSERTARIRGQGVKVGYIALQHDILVRPKPEIANMFDDYILLENMGHLAPQKSAPKIAHESIKSLGRMGVI